MSSRAVKERNRVSLYRGAPEPRAIITPEARQALAALLQDDPVRFVEMCVKAQVISLRQIPAWIDLVVSPCAADRFRAAEIAAMALDYGILHCR